MDLNQWTHVAITKSYLYKCEPPPPPHTGTSKDVIHPLSEQKGKRARTLSGSWSFLPCQLSLWGIILLLTSHPLHPKGPFHSWKSILMLENRVSHTADLLSHLEMEFHALVWTWRSCYCCTSTGCKNPLVRLWENYMKGLLLHLHGTQFRFWLHILLCEHDRSWE